ncbi:MAG: 3-deoxy-manno-octulosonate cytidylyltransferase [Gemmatimonadaceae bacterium]|nr:3-deoxy-manno-octulosonate cytidylyltransferase [Gemmatimonadaceae bacterium]MDQ3244509.1 3-deoxy-manno-octulosonate cytidylyltransferase [Gemmatimonadota bacterium]
MVIPARLAAVRLPLKPLRLLAGVPLVVRVWQRVSAMDVGDACVVATDDETVASAVHDAGGKSVITSGSHVSGTERVAEVANMPEYADFATIVNVQGDEPFIGKAAIEGAAQLVSSGRFPLGTAASPAPWDIGSNPDIVKVVVGDDGRALYFSRSAIPFRRDSEVEGIRMLQHIGVYAYSRTALSRWVSLEPTGLEKMERLEQLRPLAAGIPIGVAVAEEVAGVGIDTEDDLSRANARWQEFIAGR